VILGAWDIGSFSNDDALDWLLELQDEDEFGLLEDAFATVIAQKGGFPDASDSVVTVAAGEVFSRAARQPTGRFAS
jgi:hypothetical protein